MVNPGALLRKFGSLAYTGVKYLLFSFESRYSTAIASPRTTTETGDINLSARAALPPALILSRFCELNSAYLLEFRAACTKNGLDIFCYLKLYVVQSGYWQIKNFIPADPCMACGSCAVITAVLVVFSVMSKVFNVTNFTA